MAIDGGSASELPALLYHGSIVQSRADTQLEILYDHVLGIDRLGLITSSYSASSDEGRALLQLAAARSDTITTIRPDKPDNAFLLPGFIDTHLHAPQYLYAGTALDEPLMVWLEKYTFQSESRIDKDPHGLGKKVYSQLAKRLIQHGTTMAALYGTLTVEANMVLAKTFDQAGIRALVGKVNMDQNSPDYYTENTTTSLTATEKFITEMQSLYDADTPLQHHLVQPCITPRFIPTCSRELLTGLGKLAMQHEVCVQSHLSESGDQIAFTQSIWGERDDTSIFDEVGLLTSRSLFAHCTHLSLDNMHTLKQKGASVSHCPLSNVYFSERAFPLRQAMDIDAKVGLGSDISGGYALGIQESMRSAVAVARHREGRRKDGITDPTLTRVPTKNERQDISWRESIYLATLGGARALNCDSMIGNFEVGKSFDAQLIQVGDEDAGSQVDLFEASYDGCVVPFEIQLEKWWCSGSVADRKAVFVAGRRLR